ncbi:MAG: LysR substrate-binding domain-containing protein [Candidatus Bipolaricaulia bacterium]
MSVPRIEALAAFCAVVEHGTFTRAALALGITQPAVSQQIRALEREYGVELVERTGANVIATPAGAIVYKHAVQIRKLYEESKQRTRRDEEPMRGNLSVGASTGLGECAIPRAMVAFRALYPNARVSLQVGDSDEVLERIVQHRIDLGFVGTTRRDRRLHIEPFVSDRLALVVAASHPLAKKRTIDLRALLAIPLVIQQSGSGATRALHAALAQQGVPVKRLSIALEVGLQESAKSAVLAGAGATLLSRLGAMEELRTGSLVEIVVRGLRIEHAFHLAHRRSWPLPLLARTFVQGVRALLRNEGADLA